MVIFYNNRKLLYFNQSFSYVCCFNYYCTVDELIIEDFETSPLKSRAEVVENSWRIVESLHFLILAQQQLYNGKQCYGSLVLFI